MSASLIKRFYKTATVVCENSAYEIHLDDNVLRTPQKTIVASPHRAWCTALAKEWNAQGEHIDPSRMPLTRIMNSALDQVANNRDHVVEELTAFARTDQIYHEAEQPDVLVTHQRESWQPVRDWAAHDLDVELVVARGVIAARQPDQSIASVRRHVAKHDNMQLAALHMATKLCGSVVLALALSAGRISGEEAWGLSRIDETWQIDNWGEDEEAAMFAKSAKADVLACGCAFRLLGS